MLRIPFKSFEFGFECFESLSNGLNLQSNACYRRANSGRFRGGKGGANAPPFGGE